MSNEIIIVLILCAITAFLFGFVTGISQEYHASKEILKKQQKQENERLRGITNLVNGERE